MLDANGTARLPRTNSLLTEGSIMNSSIRALPIILLSVLCSSTAHLLLKKGATALFETSGGATLVARALGNPWLWGGIALHAIALLTWVVALGKAELSFAYP